MTLLLPCPTCEADQLCESHGYPEIVTISGVEISYRAISWRCMACGEIFDTPETMGRNLTVARGVRSTMP